MKILQVTYSLGGGVGNICTNIATQLAALGHEVDVLFAEGEDRLNLNVKNSSASKDVRFMRVKNPFTAECARIFLELDKNRRYDIVHIHSAAAIFLGMIGKVIRNKHLIFHHHGDPSWSVMATEKRRLSLNPTYKDYLSSQFLFNRRKALMALCQHIIAVSDFIKNELELTYKINSKITRIYNGVDADYFKPIDSIPENKKLILFVGRINPVKGLHYLIEAMSYVCKSIPNAELLIVGKGNGPYYHRLLEMINHHRLEGRVKFVGYITKRGLLNLYNTASLVVIPSLYEPFSLVAVEALSCGRTVIASDTGGLKEIISNGRNGLLVPPRRPRDLADAIISVLNQENFSLEMRKNTRETVLKHFTLQKQVKQILNMYNYVLNKQVSDNKRFAC